MLRFKVLILICLSVLLPPASAEPGTPVIQVDGKAVSGVVRRPNDRTTGFKIFSSFQGGSIYYTLDGTEPSFASTRYNGETVYLRADTTVRAIAYSLDFSQSAISEPTVFDFVPVYRLNLRGGGFGEISLAPEPFLDMNDPQVSLYMEGTELRLTAKTDPGWVFMWWLQNGETTTSNPVTVLITNELWMEVVMGTMVSIQPSAHGSINKAPSADLVAYNQSIVFHAFPDDGYYFAAWGGAMTGSENPKGLRVLAVNPTVSALFLPRPRILIDDQFGVRGGQFGFAIMGTGNQQVVVEALEGLDQTGTSLGTITLSSGKGYFSEPLPTSNRFYRLRLPN